MLAGWYLARDRDGALHDDGWEVGAPGMSQLDDPRRMTRPVLESTSLRELRNRAGVRGVVVDGLTRDQLIEAILTVEAALSSVKAP